MRIAWNKGKKGLQVAWNKGKKLGFIPKGAFKKGHVSWNTEMKGYTNKGSFIKGHKGIKNSGNFKKGHATWNIGLPKEKQPGYGKIAWNRNMTLRTEKCHSQTRKSHNAWCSQKGNLLHVPRGFIIHHLDFNSKNNNLKNLQLLDETTHKKFHVHISKFIRRRGIINT